MTLPEKPFNFMDFNKNSEFVSKQLKKEQSIFLVLFSAMVVIPLILIPFNIVGFLFSAAKSGFLNGMEKWKTLDFLMRKD